MPVERLVAARCADPFSHLGLLANPDGPGLKLTAWLPDALEVRVRDLKSGKIVATLTSADGAGLFETVFTRRKNPFPYQLIASYPDASAESIDPYQFQAAAWAPNCAPWNISASRWQGCASQSMRRAPRR